jgi:lysophospholipase L1-like esterase
MPSSASAQTAKSHRFIHRLQNSRYASAAPHEILAQLTQLDAHPLWIRLLFFNDLPTAWRLDGAAVALTSMIGNGYTPYNADGKPDRTLWRRVTFPGDGAWVVEGPPSVPSSGNPSLEFPANPREGNRPVLLTSDWIPLSGPTRRHGHGALLLVRAHAACGLRYAGCVGRADGRIGTVHRGFRITGPNLTTDKDQEVRRDDTVFSAYGIEAITNEPIVTVMGVGDSIIHSSCTTGEMSGFGVRACAMLSRPGLRFSYFNEGYPGRNSLGFIWNGDWMVRHARPEIVLIQTWSGNDTWDAAMADQAFERAMALAEATRRHGGQPVLVTAAPVFAGDPGAEQHRMSNVTRVRAAAAQGMRVLDLDRIWGTGGSPNSYRKDCGSGDGMHPSDAGCIVAAKALVPLLRDCLGLGDDATRLDDTPRFWGGIRRWLGR